MQLYGNTVEANACPCCTRIFRDTARAKQRALKKKARRTAHMEIEYALHEAWLEELGAETVAEVFQSAKKRRESDLLFALRHSGYASGSYDPYEDWDISWDRSAYEETYDDGYGDRWYDPYENEWDRYPEYADPRESYWPALWVDGKVKTPYDADEQEYDAWNSYYLDWHYGDQDAFDGEDEFWGDQSGPATPATIAITREREREKLKAGDRFYRQNRRTRVILKAA